MNENPVDLLFGGMEKLGPGSNVDTLHVLHLLPKRAFRVVIDAGCGTGRQTIALAQELGTVIQAVDTHRPFLNDLARRAKEARVEQLVQTHCLDMNEIPQVFSNIDLLWSEGAAYNIGFSNALSIWAPAVALGGFVVVSELCWIKEKAPDKVRDFFQTGYPDMRSARENIVIAERAGYRVLATHMLPPDAWIDGYYDVLQPRALRLLEHPDAAVRDFAAETIREIEIFGTAEQSYGYVFYVLQRL